MQSKRKNNDRRRAPQKAKKTWTTPALTRHGDVEKITERIGAYQVDGITGSVLPN